MLSSHPHARDVQERLRGNQQPNLGLKYELRDVGTASPQLCSHIWQGQPFPGSQQMLQAQAALSSRAAVQAGGAGWGLLPFSLVLLAALEPRSGSKHLPLATVHVRELAAPTTEPGLVPNHPPQRPCSSPGAKTTGGLQMGGGKEAAATPKPALAP